MLGVQDICLINIRDYIIPEFARTITDDYTFTEQGILNHEGMGWTVSVNSKHDINLFFNGDKDYKITINIGPYYDKPGNIYIIKTIRNLTKIKDQKTKNRLSYFAYKIIDEPTIYRDMDLKNIRLFNVIINGNEIEWKVVETYVSQKYPEYTCDILTRYACDIISPLIIYTRNVSFSDKLKDNLEDYQNEMITYSIYGVEPTIQGNQNKNYYYYGEKNLYDCLTLENETTNDYDFERLTKNIKAYYQNDYLEPIIQLHAIYYLKNLWKDDKDSVKRFLEENKKELENGFSSSRKF